MTNLQSNRKQYIDPYFKYWMDKCIKCFIYAWIDLIRDGLDEYMIEYNYNNRTLRIVKRDTDQSDSCKYFNLPENCDSENYIILSCWTAMKILACERQLKRRKINVL